MSLVHKNSHQALASSNHPILEPDYQEENTLLQIDPEFSDSSQLFNNTFINDENLNHGQLFSIPTSHIESQQQQEDSYTLSNVEKYYEDSLFGDMKVNLSRRISLPKSNNFKEMSKNVKQKYDDISFGEVSSIADNSFQSKFSDLTPQILKMINQQNQKQKLNQQQIFVISFILFCCHYGCAIEIVFISPYFLKLDPPDAIDSIVWVFPTLFGALFIPMAKFFMNGDQLSQKQRKSILIIALFISLTGLLILSEAANIAFYLDQSQFMKQNTAELIISIVGFIIQDVGQQTLMQLVGLYINKLVHQQTKDKAENILILSDSLGQFSAYITSSILVFSLNFITIKSFKENLSNAYRLGIFFIIVSIILSLKYLKTDPEDKQLKGGFLEIAQNFQMSVNTFFPGAQNFNQLNLKSILLCVSNYLIYLSLLTVSAYATLWTGISVLQSTPYARSRQMQNELFDMGVSWGALTLSISAVFYFVTCAFIKSTQNPFSLKIFYISIQLIANFSLLVTYYSDDFYTLLFSLPMWGSALATYNSIPCLLIEQISVEEEQIQTFGELTYVISIFAQFTIFLIVPLVYQVLELYDDISLSLIMASICGGTGASILIYL